jgi:hypothetical protein
MVLLHPGVVYGFDRRAEKWAEWTVFPNHTQLIEFDAQARTGALWTQKGPDERRTGPA